MITITRIIFEGNDVTMRREEEQDETWYEVVWHGEDMHWEFERREDALSFAISLNNALMKCSRVERK